MSLRARRLVLTALMVAAIVGGLLIVTADDDGGPQLDEVVTAEGLVTKVPAGWEAVDGRPFDFAPAGKADLVIERWTVARACGPDGCRTRSLAQWRSVGEALPTFASAFDDEGELLFGLEEEWRDNARILRAETASGARQTFVAAFADGADFYVECAATQFEGDDLVDAIVDVCIDTTVGG